MLQLIPDPRVAVYRWYRQAGLPLPCEKGIMPRIPQAVQQCVNYLYPTVGDAKRGTKFGGTGFFVGVLESNPGPRGLLGRHHIYCVTNRHVIDGDATIIRMNSNSGATVVYPTEQSDWVFHPDGDDVAVCYIPEEVTVDAQVSFIPEIRFLTREIIKEEDLGPGSEVFIAGRFIAHDGQQQNMPAIRFGHISMMPAPVYNAERGLKQESFALDAFSTRGLSGAPAFVHFPCFYPTNEPTARNLRVAADGYWWLLGVNWGNVGHSMPVTDRNGSPVDPAEMVNEQSGMSVTVPCWKLRETLDDPALTAHRIAVEGKPRIPDPLGEAREDAR